VTLGDAVTRFLDLFDRAIARTVNAAQWLVLPPLPSD